MNKINIDIVSDLHIDLWDTSIYNKYPDGKIKDFPYIFPNKKSNILIIAGDISDDINISLKYINELSKIYQNVLFIDGNHEHTLQYPQLYTTNYIFNMTKKLNENIFYLPISHYKINKTIILGVCGWWDYNNGDMDSIKKNLNYFEGWINHFKEDDNLEFIDNVIKKSKDEYQYLKYCIDIYNNDDNIDNIILVTHTVPLFEYLNDKKINNSNDKSNGSNSLFIQLIDNNKKISHWIFGHTHKQFEETINNIKFICNPRGRPNDFNRLTYNLKTLVI